MDDRKIMYVCGLCADNNPEGCGHYDRDEIAVMPDGTWLCEDCADEFDNMEGCGVRPNGSVEDAIWPMFSDFPHPPEYKPQ